jgi:uncharacterized protein YceK
MTFRVIVAILVPALCGRVGSWMTRNWNGGGFGRYPYMAVYYDVAQEKDLSLGLVSLPLDFILDTVSMPVDIDNVAIWV